MASAKKPDDEPLPATFGFVMAIGVIFAVGWFLMFFLLKARWG